MESRKSPSRKYINLHAHTVVGSLWDALDFPEKHMNYAWENGMSAMAITEHGNMNSVPYQIFHAEKMKKEGKAFKPIFGVEAYFVPDLEKWRADYERYKAEKKIKDDDEASGIVTDSKDVHDDATVDMGVLKGRSHFLLLAQNQEGLYNLYKLVSLSNKRENFYRFPRMDYSLLKEYNKGIIASTACLSGYFSILFSRNKDKSREEIMNIFGEEVKKFQEIFGDRFYGELQWNKVPQQHVMNQFMIDLSKIHGFKLISTADSHYPTPSSWKDRELYKRLGWLGHSVKVDWLSKELPKSIDDLAYELYPKNGDQMWEAYRSGCAACDVSYDDDLVSDSMARTHQIAFDLIEDFSPDKKIRLPQFVVPEGETPEYALTREAIAGLKKLGLAHNRQYNERLKRELKIIHKKDFSRYFLTMKAVVDFAKESQLLGPGRGSAAGSLLSYCLGITQVDPIKWNLQFERFLSEESEGYPDIDVDYEEPMQLKDALKDKWGESTVVPVSNFSTLQLRSLIKDISKFYDVPFQEVNDVTNKMMFEAVPKAKQEHGITAGVYAPTFEEVKRFSPTLQKFLTKYPDIAVHIEALSGQIRQISRHASGTIIGENLDKYMPLIFSHGVIQTPWPEGAHIRLLEPMGFIKFDLLGLASLRMMNQAIRLILQNHHGIVDPSFTEVRKFYDDNLHPDKLDLKDKKVYEHVFQSGNFFNVFQFSEQGAQSFCKKIGPASIEEISDVTAIYRPGPLGSGVDQKYAEAKENPDDIEYLHPILESVLGPTKGQVVYQEQIAQIVHLLGDNVSLEEGNQLRKLFIKKGAGTHENKKKRIYDKYIRGCAQKKIPNGEAEKLWKALELFNFYAFNKSHSLSYSLISYQCAHLLTYYPAEWACAFLEKDAENEEKKEKSVNAARQMGYAISMVDLNRSGRNWTVLSDGKTLQQPFSSIKGIGDTAIDQIMPNRPFRTVEELLFNESVDYGKLNKRTLYALACTGGLNDLMDERFNNQKHFLFSLTEPKPKTLRELAKNIELFKDVKDFTEEEKIELLAEISGVFPMERVVSDEMKSELAEKMIPPISEFDNDLGLCYGVVRSVAVKTTKKGKPYFVVKVLDRNSAQIQVRCWGIRPDKDHLFINRPYVLKPKYDSSWGFSTSGAINRSWQLLA